MDGWMLKRDVIAASIAGDAIGIELKRYPMAKSQLTAFFRLLRTCV